MKTLANINVVYGGGQLGLMGRMAKAAHENGSKVTAIIPPIFNTDSVHVCEMKKKKIIKLFQTIGYRVNRNFHSFKF